MKTILAVVLMAVLLEPSHRISVDDAARLIQPLAHPWEGALDIQELTKPDLWQAVQWQVFRSRTQFRTWVVKGTNVVEIGAGWGGPGVYEFTAVDLNRNGVPDIVNAYGTGSGMTTYHIEVTELGDPVTKVPLNIHSRSPLYLERIAVNEIRVLAQASSKSGKTVVIGDVVAETSGGQPSFVFRAKARLPHGVWAAPPPP